MASEFRIRSYSQTYSEKGLAQSKLWTEETLCLTIAGENTGESAILDFPACFPDSIVGFIPDTSVSNIVFIKYLLDIMRVQFKSVSRGATQDNLSLEKLLSFKLAIPSIEVQHRIASILSAYGDLIENNTRRIAILEEMAQRLYEEWFVQFRFPGHDAVGLRETQLGAIPEDWSVQVVDEAFSIVGGGTPSKAEDAYWVDGTINWYSPSDLTKAGTAFMDASSVQINDLGLRKSSAQMFPPFSVMMTSRATIGAIAINTTEACTNQGFITCLPNERFPLYLLFHWLKSNVETFISLGTGATFKEITKGTFKTIPVALPPAELVKDFEARVAPIMGQLLRLQRKNANLRAQRDLLLPKLISGEIDVSEVAEPGADAA